MDITCPYCGAKIGVDISNDLHSHPVAEMECSNISCGAIWNSSGDPVRTPEQYQAEVAALAARWT